MKKLEGYKKTAVMMGIFFLTALLLELSLFNVQFWRTLGCKELSVPLDLPVYEGMLGHTAEGAVVLGEGNYLQFSTAGAKQRISSIALKTYCADGDETWWGYMRTQYAEILSPMVSVDLVLSEGEKNTLLKGRLLDGEKEEWAVIPLPVGNDADILTMQLNGVKGSSVVVSEICLNKTVPFRFVPLRMLAVFFFLAFVYGMRPVSKNWEYPFLNEREKVKRRYLVGSLLAFVCMGLCIANLIRLNQVYMQSETDFHPYTDLARALAGGQLSLFEEPSAELLALENPYDPVAREEVRAPFHLDYAYYEGKYYIYFGVIPCLLLYLPYYLITNNDLPGIAALTIMLMACYLGLWMLIRSLIRRYRPHTPIGAALLLWLGAGAALSLPAAMGDACNYYTPMLSAVDFFLFGMSFSLMAADTLEENAESPKGRIYLALGSLFLACVAGCRPQLVLGAAATLPFLLPLLFPKKGEKRSIAWKTVLCFALPYIVTALGLMIYNAERFGSPVDFGAMYNLTFAFLTNVAFHWETVGAGLYYYLLRPLTLTAGYPYLDRSSLEWSNPSVLASHPSVGGLFITYPVLLLGAVCFLPKWKGRNRELALVGGISFALVPVLSAVTAVMGGLMDRYKMDISVFAALAFVCGYLLLASVLEESKKLALFRGIFLAGVLLAVLVSGLMFAVEGLNSLYNVNPEAYKAIASAIEFWR